MENRVIFIVGEDDWNSKVAYYHRRKGHVKPISAGVFIRTGLTPEQEKKAVLLHACRIAKYKHPESILSGSSAYYHGVVNDTITLCSNNKYPSTNIGGYLKIRHMYVKAPNNFIPYENITVKDPLGEMMVKTLTDEMIILQSFTSSKSKNTESIISIKDLSVVVERAINDHGSKYKLIEKLSIIAENMGFNRQLDLAKVFIERFNSYSQEKKFIHDYGIYWNKKEIAQLKFDGKRWEFDYAENFKMQLSVSNKTKEGKVPYFIESLIPEGWNDMGHAEDGHLSKLKEADRYTSNIVIRPKEAKNDIIVDTMGGQLRNFTTERNEFTGRIEGFPSSFDDEFYSHIVDIVQDPMTPRMSGCQIKVPANLSEDGILSPAVGKSFTHIVKLPAAGECGSLGAMEWYSMALAYLSGIQTENFAITNIEGLGPVFIAERFDVRASKEDKSNYLCEDFCSAFGFSNGQKYNGDLIDVAKVLSANSTDFKQDARNLFKQVILSWLVCNSDMHLKNILLLKKANDEMTGFDSVRLSPAYDIMCTKVYTAGNANSAAMAISKERNYTVDSLMLLAKSLDIPRDEADSLIKGVMMKLSEAVEILDQIMPDLVRNHELSMQHIEKCKMLIDIRSSAFYSEMSKPKKNKFAFR